MPVPIRFRYALALTALTGLAIASPAYADTTVFNQPTNLNGSDASQNDINPGGFGNFATAYDNFTLGSTTALSAVTWVGDYFSGNPATISNFTIQFYADNFGIPGTPLLSETIAGSANETGLGFDSFGKPAYSYSTSLPTPFVAAAGQKYWMSIVPDLGYPPSWGWEVGTGGDGASYQDANGFPQVVSNDLSFSLIGAEVTTPEPGSVALMVGMGLTGVTCLRRRRVKKTA